MEAGNKNIDEYNEGSDAYQQWSESNPIMVNWSYYSTIASLDAVEGKTFAEIGCGPSPIGRRLAAKGAKKVYGVDVSDSMIEIAKKQIAQLGLQDQFSFHVADVFDEQFVLPEKVDCVVLCYIVSAFVTSQEMLTKLLARCRDLLKEDGYVLITDFCYFKYDDWGWAGQRIFAPEKDGIV